MYMIHIRWKKKRLWLNILDNKKPIEQRYFFTSKTRKNENEKAAKYASSRKRL